MDDHITDNPAMQPRKRRRQRPNGRWSNPASPLQAARFARRLSGKVVVLRIRDICEGHAGRPCHIDVSKLSDYETNNRRPGLEHITAFCKFYGMSPEALGLIHWRDTPEPGTDDTDSAQPGGQTPANHAAQAEAEPEAEPETDCEPDQEQIVLDWLLRSATSVASVLMAALADYPLNPAAANVSASTPGSEPPDEDPPPAEAAGVG